MTPAEMKALSDCLEQDDAEHRKMRATGGPARETVSTATGKALAAGKSLKEIFAALAAGFMTGGWQGAIAAIMALLA